MSEVIVKSILILLMIACGVFFINSVIDTIVSRLSDALETRWKIIDIRLRYLQAIAADVSLTADAMEAFNEKQATLVLEYARMKGVEWRCCE